MQTSKPKNASKTLNNKTTQTHKPQMLERMRTKQSNQGNQQQPQTNPNLNPTSRQITNHATSHLSIPKANYKLQANKQTHNQKPKTINITTTVNKFKKQLRLKQSTQTNSRTSTNIQLPNQKQAIIYKQQKSKTTLQQHHPKEITNQKQAN